MKLVTPIEGGTILTIGAGDEIDQRESQTDEASSKKFTRIH